MLCAHRDAIHKSQEGKTTEVPVDRQMRGGAGGDAYTPRNTVDSLKERTVHVCTVHVCVHPCVLMWEPEAKDSTLFFDTASRTEH